MRKILLVIDEYRELVAIENLLRRVGFDVLSVGKDILVNDALAGFLPDIVIVTMKGRAVDGVKVSSRVRKLTPAPRVAFVTGIDNAAASAVEQKLFTDAVIALPLQPVAVIRTVAQLSNLDPNPLIGKFQKLSSGRMADGKDDVVFEGRGAEGEPVGGPAGPRFTDDGSEFSDGAARTEGWDPVTTRGKAATLRTERSDRYEQFLRRTDEPVDGLLPKEIVAAAVRKLKLESAKEAEDLERLEAQKREFVRALFVDGDGNPEEKIGKEG